MGASVPVSAAAGALCQIRSQIACNSGSADSLALALRRGFLDGRVVVPAAAA